MCAHIVGHDGVERLIQDMTDDELDMALDDLSDPRAGEQVQALLCEVLRLRGALTAIAVINGPSMSWPGAAQERHKRLRRAVEIAKSAMRRPSSAQWISA